MFLGTVANTYTSLGSFCDHKLLLSRARIYKRLMPLDNPAVLSWSVTLITGDGGVKFTGMQLPMPGSVLKKYSI